MWGAPGLPSSPAQLLGLSAAERAATHRAALLLQSHFTAREHVCSSLATACVSHGVLHGVCERQGNQLRAPEGVTLLRLPSKWLNLTNSLPPPFTQKVTIKGSGFGSETMHSVLLRLNLARELTCPDHFHLQTKNTRWKSQPRASRGRLRALTGLHGAFVLLTRGLQGENHGGPRPAPCNGCKRDLVPHAVPPSGTAAWPPGTQHTLAWFILGCFV